MVADTESLLSTLRGLSSSTFQNDDERMLVLREVVALGHRLERPFEALMRLTYQEPSYDFAMVMACEISLFKHLSDSPKTTSQLAKDTGMEAELLRRFLRHLGAHGTIVERGEDLWVATELSKTLAEPDAAAGVHFGAPYFTRIYHSGPSFFRKQGYNSPHSVRHTLFNHAFDCDGQSHWEHMRKHPHESRQNNMMLAYLTRHHPSWLDMCDAKALFDVDELQDPQAAAFIDIGGGVAVDVLEVRRRFPRSTLPAKVVLQDVEKVIDEVKHSEKVDEEKLEEIELQTYDFFKPQPIKGARVYFLSSIIHDWPDEDARKILGNVAAAMKRGFSKLFISDYVVPSTGVKPQVSGLDLVMMSVLGAGERPQHVWDELLRSQGLKLVKKHERQTTFKSLLEIELAD